VSAGNGSDDEGDLLKRTRAGDESAFVSLYRRHRDPLYRFSLRMLGDGADAEDVVHDCLLSLLQRPEGYDPVLASLRAYLFGIARHLVWQRLRRDGNVDSLDEPEAGAVADSTPGPLAILTRRETTSEVANAVLSLTPHQREAVVLFEYEGLSLAEIAALAGVDVGTVSARLHRARARLRKRLAHLAGAVRNPMNGER
jgi:RNA polymerase sigma-70 factor, ECF subfamily